MTPKIQIAIRIGNRLIIVCAGIVNHLHTFLFVHKNFIYITEILMYVDELLKISDKHHKEDRKVIWCYVIVSQSFLALQLYFVYILKDISVMILCLYTFSVYINLGVAANELQYIAFCETIRSRFKLINENLKQLKNGQNISASDIELLRHTHLTLVKLTEKTNSVYNTRLFFSFFCCMTNVLSNLYFMIFGEALIFEPSDVMEKIKFIIVTLLWAFYYTMRLTLLCIASQMLCKEVIIIFLLLLMGKITFF